MQQASCFLKMRSLADCPLLIANWPLPTLSYLAAPNLLIYGV
jgi:hypothetical protein